MRVGHDAAGYRPVPARSGAVPGPRPPPSAGRSAPRRAATSQNGVVSATPTAIPAEAPPTATALQPASTGRRVVAWLIDIVIVAALVGVVYLLGLIKINGCDTWDQSTQQFGGSCPFESTREVTRSDGSVDVVYVLDSGRELPADHPTVKTALLGTRIVDPPEPGHLPRRAGLRARRLRRGPGRPGLDARQAPGRGAPGP